MWLFLCACAQPHNDILEKAFSLIKTCHVRGKEEVWLNQRILQGALRALDPHSAYFPPKQYQAVSRMNQNTMYGVGLEVKECDGKFVVQHVISETPAANAGIKIGHVLTHIDGGAIPPATPPDVITAQICGKPGTIVVLGVNNKSVKIKRTTVRVSSVRHCLKNSILFLQIRFFLDTTAKELKQLIECHLKKCAVKRIVLDLRSNPGGSLQGAVAVVGLFVDNATVVHIKSHLTEYNKTHLCEGKALYPSIPLTVWVDRYTASAAEIVAAALKDHKRARIFGGESFGKGCVQDFFDLPKGYGGIKLTVGYCYSPLGRALHREYF